MTDLRKRTSDITLVWDETPNDVIEYYEIYRAAYLPVLSTKPTGQNCFIIDCKAKNWFKTDDWIQIEDSTAVPTNNGLYLVKSATSEGDNTRIWIYTPTEDPTYGKIIPTTILNDGDLGTNILSQLAGTTKSTSYTDKEMPIGYYYYVIYGLIGYNSYIDPSEVIYKTSPPDENAPTTPYIISARRTGDYQGVEINWSDDLDTSKKGYIIWRTLNPSDTAPYWEVIATTPSTKYTDKEIPAAIDPEYQQTYVAYFVQEYDIYGNVSIIEPPSTSADLAFYNWLFGTTKTTLYELFPYFAYYGISTDIFAIPTIKGLRAALDYTAINAYWDQMQSEDNNDGVAIYMRPETTQTYAFAGFAEYPLNFIRIEGPLAKNVNYLIKAACIRGGIHNIIMADTTSTADHVAIPGSQQSLFSYADQIAITNSAGYDATYTVLSTYPTSINTGLSLDTTVGMSQETIRKADIINNYFEITGNLATAYNTGKVLLNVHKSNYNNGSYKVVKAVNGYGVTRIYVAEQIPSTEISGHIATGRLINITTTKLTLQDPPMPIAVPDYPDDTILPTSPTNLIATLDPENNRALLNWSRASIDDDFLEYQIEYSTVGDFPITGLVTLTRLIKVTGDQRAYIITGDTITIYRCTNTGNNRDYEVTNVTYNAGNTEIEVDATIDQTVINGYVSSPLAWPVVDKTKNTNYALYLPFRTNQYGKQYNIRIRAVDRSGNYSAPQAANGTASPHISINWWNPDIHISSPTRNPLLLPQWVGYTKSVSTSYTNTDMKQYKFTINDGARRSKYFRRYVLYALSNKRSAVPGSLFSSTEDEIMAMNEYNLISVDIIQSLNATILEAVTGALGVRYFKIDGSYGADFELSATFQVSGCAMPGGNDGTYTVHSLEVTGGIVKIYTVETIAGSITEGYINGETLIWAAIEDWFGQMTFGPSAGILKIMSL